MLTMRFIGCLFLATILSFKAYTQPPVEYLQGLGKVDYFELKSEIIEQTYHLYVSQPPNLDEGRQYPTLYLLDGGLTFPILAGYHHYLRLQGFPPMIIVGISYGTTDWRQGNQRSRDYTIQHADLDYWGGAENYHKILETEIFPLVEQNNPVNPQRRILFGQSLGGQFVIYSALNRPNQFWARIASNPALNQNLDEFLTADKAPEINNLPTLIITLAEFDNEAVKPSTLQWMEHWKVQDNAPFNLHTVYLVDQGHFSAITESFRKSLSILFDSQ